LTAERENGKSLVEQYRAQSADALKTLGIVETTRTQRMPCCREAILIGTAARAIRQPVKSGEMNANTILSAVPDVADRSAKKQLNYTEVSADIKQKIDERVRLAGLCGALSA
jgi:hypothetical protein